MVRMNARERARPKRIGGRPAVERSGKMPTGSGKSWNPRGTRTSAGYERGPGPISDRSSPCGMGRWQSGNPRRRLTTDLRWY